MTLIFLWSNILAVFGVILFIVFSYLCFVWTYRKTLNRQNIMTGAQVAAFYVFKVFLYCALLFILIYLIFTFSLTVR